MTRSSVGSAVGFAALFLFGFVAMNHFQTPATASPGYAEAPEASEVLLVLLVDTGCVGSTDPALPEVWAELVDRARETLPASMDRVTTMGAVTSRNPEEGYEFLEPFGHFHEVVVGRRWSSAALRYMYRDLRGPATVPQVVVVHREFRRGAGGAMEASEERVLARYTGPEGMRRAADRLVVPDPAAWAER